MPTSEAIAYLDRFNGVFHLKQSPLWAECVDTWRCKTMRCVWDAAHFQSASSSQPTSIIFTAGHKHRSLCAWGRSQIC